MAEPRARLRPWSPEVAGIREVLHAEFPPGAHEYPMHAHDTWTLLLIDHGVVRYHLGGHERIARPGEVTLLPPRVPHDGAAATKVGFRKRVLYLDPEELDPGLSAAAVRHPARSLLPLHRMVTALHSALVAKPDPLTAEHLLVTLLNGLDNAWTSNASGSSPAHAAPPGAAGSRLAERLRELLDADVAAGVSLQEAAEVLHSSRSALVHAFRRRFGMAPHQYVISRRLDLARAYLLDGAGVAETAVLAGFHDQSHLTRHFKRVLGVPPGAWVAAST